MKWCSSLMLAVALFGLCTIIPAAAATKRCNEAMTMADVNLACEHNKNDLRNRTQDPKSPYKYRLKPICQMGGSTDEDCWAPLVCTEAPRTYRYRVYRALRESEEWDNHGTVCLSHSSQITDSVTEIEISQAFRELTWPEATLVIQPPNGETLVNLPTIFHTPDTTPHNQTITLLGTTIDLEATPTSWTWHWAQSPDPAAAADKQPHSTTTPGAPHPHETITHTYTRATTVNPSLDVTYTGRYRTNNGPWQNIEEPHTVAGTPQQLTILQARPVLTR